MDPRHDVRKIEERKAHNTTTEGSVHNYATSESATLSLGQFRICSLSNVAMQSPPPQTQ